MQLWGSSPKSRLPCIFHIRYNTTPSPTHDIIQAIIYQAGLGVRSVVIVAPEIAHRQTQRPVDQHVFVAALELLVLNLRLVAMKIAATEACRHKKARAPLVMLWTHCIQVGNLYIQATKD